MAKKDNPPSQKAERSLTVQIFLMGRPYQVPAELTIMKAIEHIGFQIIRGAGCRGGFCGACATIYRKEDDYYLHADLACQKQVENGMYVTMLPFTPAERKEYDMNSLNSNGTNLLKLYPVISRCVACNTCTKACPQELEVMDYVQAAIRGDITKVAELSFDCIQCGLCAIRCPAMIVPYHVAQVSRRIQGRYIQPHSPGITLMLERLQTGEFKPQISELMRLPLEKIKERYSSREISKEE